MATCNEEPKPGDLIEIFHLGYEHWAIYVGDGYVIHLDPIGDFPRNGSSSVLSVLNSRAEVKRERLEDVVAGCRYRINNHLDHKYKPQSVDKIISSAKEKVGQQMPYNVLNKNCEHFVTDLRYGQPRSLQVEKYAIGGGVVLGLGFLGAIGLSVMNRRRQTQ